MIKKILIGVAAIILVLGIFVLSTVIDAGGFKEINPHAPGTCSIVEGVIGAEDITTDHASGLAYISSHDRRTWVKTGDAEGGIFLYRPGSMVTPLAMPNDMEGHFHPHGISLWQNPDGPDRLFVVNHPNVNDGPVTDGADSQVDIFEIREQGLHHIRSVKTDGPYSLNDVTAVGPDSFFATIDKGSETSLGRMLESYLKLARGGIAFGHGDGMHKVKGGLVYPNGIQWDGNRLWVVEVTGERLLGFDADLTTGALAQVLETDIDSGLDNIELGQDGSLWIGAHAKAILFPGHAKDAKNRSPSQALKVTVTDDGFDVTEVYLNDGDPISGSSVAAPHKDHLLIGSVFEPFILDCKM